MASKRSIKKELNYVSSELFAEVVAAGIFSNREDKDSSVQTLLNAVVKTHSDYIMRVSHPEPGMKASKYYKVLVENYLKDMDSIIDQIKNIL